MKRICARRNKGEKENRVCERKQKFYRVRKISMIEVMIMWVL